MNPDEAAPVRFSSRVPSRQGRREQLARARRRSSMWIRRPTTLRYVTIGRETYISPNCDLRPPIEIGDFGFIGPNCLSRTTPLTIGHFCLIADNVAFVGGDHEMASPGVPMLLAGRATVRPITIADDVWIGHGATILAGAVIGEGSVIAAGSVVVGDIPPYSIFGGVPARLLRPRFEAPADETFHRNSLQIYRETRTLTHVDLANAHIDWGQRRWAAPDEIG